MRKRFRLLQLPPNVWILTTTSFLTDISSEMLLNLLPLYLANVLGARSSAIGLIEGVADAAASLLKAFSGWLSDRLQARKGLAVAGYALSTLAKPFLYFATTWYWVLGVRFADRVGKGVRTAPRDALLADSIKKEHRGLTFGLHRAGDTAGAVIGLALALLAVTATQRGVATLTRNTFQVIVLLSLIPAVLAVLTLAFGAREVRPQTQAPAKRPTFSLAGLGRPFRLYLLVVMLFALGNFSDAFLILRAQSAGLSVSAILALLLAFNLVYTVASTPAGALSDRIGRRRVLTLGWLLFAAVYAGFAYLSADWHVWVLMAIYGLYYGFTEGTARALVADLVPADRRGTAYGVFNAAIGVIALPASLLAGVLWQGVGTWQGLGPQAPFLLGSALALLAALMLATLRLDPSSG
jgi:MFS family permease